MYPGGFFEMWDGHLLLHGFPSLGLALSEVSVPSWSGLEGAGLQLLQGRGVTWTLMSPCLEAHRKDRDPDFIHVSGSTRATHLPLDPAI